MGGAGCTVITVTGDLQGGVELHIYLADQITPDLGDKAAALVDTLQLEMFSGSPGSFDLASTGLNDNYSTCEQCVRLFEDIPGDGTSAGRQYFQAMGTIDIDVTSNPLNGALTATLTDVTLVEVTVDPDDSFKSTLVEGGECVIIGGVVTLTTPPPKMLCAGDCGTYNGGTSCNCDEKCFEAGDCCPDICEVGVCDVVLSTECGMVCVPDCTGKVCGNDACEGSCGDCGAGEICDAGGQCVPGPTCTEIDITADLAVGGSGNIFSTDAISPDLGDLDAALLDGLQIEFWGGGPHTGTFDLGSATVNDNFATCGQCFRAFEDIDPDTGAANKVYFQSAGTMVVDATADPTNGLLLATLSGVTLVEVTVDADTLVSTPVVGGGCLAVTGPITIQSVVLPVESCAGNCGNLGTTCNCDSLCFEFDDCCTDVCDVAICGADFPTECAGG